MSPSTFAALRNDAIARDLGVVLPPLSRPARFVGTVDATRDSRFPAARSLEQCAGMQRSSTAVLLVADALLEPRTAKPLPLLQRIAGAVWRWC